MIPGRTTVTVPEGHEVHVNAPGGMAPPQTGMVADPMAQSALAAMNTTLAGMARPRSEAGAGKTEPKPKPKAEAKKPKKKAKKKAAAEESED